MTLPMFPECAAAGCANLVATQGHPCDQCRDAFGPLLRENPGQPPMTADTQARRDADTRAAYRAAIERQARAKAIDTGQQTKPGQTCWLCEQRRTCTRVNGQWECSTCAQLT